MKYFLMLSVLLLFAFCNLKAESDSLVVTLKNGQVVKIAISQIQKIKFENVTEVNDIGEQTHYLAITGNFPNPVESATNIEFEIAQSGTVEVLIYNQSGILIQTMVCQNCRSGRNTLQWNCLDNSNNRVTSGIYYYEVRFGKEVQSRKMIVIK